MPCPDNGAMTVADTSLTPTRRSAAPVPRLASGRGARAAGPGARRMPGVTRGGWPALVTCMLLTLSLALLAPSAAALEILNLGESGSRYPLGASFEILEDANHEMDIGEFVRGGGDSGFEASQQAVPNFGFTQSTIWFRVQLRNESATRRWLLHTSYPLIDDMTVYLVGPEGLRSTHFAGEVLPSKQGEGDAPRYTVELDLGGEDAITLYVRTRTANAHMVPLTLWKPTAFIAYTNGVRFLLGIYFGVAVAMLIYNLMLYLSVRDTAYLYYVGFIFCFAVLMLSVNGLATEYLWPGSLWWSDRVIPLSIAFTVMTGIQFTRRLLETHANLNTGDLLLRSLLLLGLMFVPLSLLLGMGPAVSIAAGLGLSAALALFGCAWASWRAGVTVAPLYLLAWVAFLLGCIAYALLAFGVLPANFLTEYSIQIGSAMEVLLLSFVLAYRIKLLKEENERVQREATETLETRVIDRTEELNLALAQLSAANEQLALLSEEDKLTGAKNRHYFDAHFDEAWRKRRTRWQRHVPVADRHRSLQAHQRSSWPPGRRPGAARGGGSRARRAGPLHGRPRALRRRRVHRHAAARRDRRRVRGGAAGQGAHRAGLDAQHRRAAQRARQHRCCFHAASARGRTPATDRAGRRGALSRQANRT